MIGDSKATNISELTGMVVKSHSNPDYSFFNPGKNDGMNSMHRRTCHTAVSRLHRMCETKAADGLDELSSAKDVNNMCEA